MRRRRGSEGVYQNFGRQGRKQKEIHRKKKLHPGKGAEEKGASGKLRRRNKKKDS